MYIIREIEHRVQSKLQQCKIQMNVAISSVVPLMLIIWKAMALKL